MSAQIIQAMRLRSLMLDQAADWMLSHYGGWRSETRDNGHGYHLSVHEMRMQAAEYRAIIELADDPEKFEAQLNALVASINGNMIGSHEQEGT